MIWSEGLKLLCYSTTIMIKQSDILLNYDSVNYFNEFDTLFPNILYFTTYGQWEKLRCENGVSFVILGEDPAQSKEFSPNNNTNLLYFYDKKDFLTFYTKLQGEIAFEHRMNAEMQKLFLMVSENAGLQKIVDKIAEIYQRPVDIIDNAFSFIACSKNYVFTDPIMSEAVMNGHLPADARNYMRKISVPNSRRKITDTMLITPTHLKFNNKLMKNYFTYIYLNNINICSFSVIEIGDNLIPENELRYLPRIASVLSAELQKKSFYMLNKSNYYTHLFSTLLGDQTADQHDLHDRLQQFGYTLKKFKYIIYVDFLIMYISGPEIQLLADRLRFCFENSFYMIAEDSILYFMSREEGRLINRKDVDEWNKTLEIQSSNIRVGVSSAFENLDLSKQHFKDAKEAIIIGKRNDPDKKIYLYDDYRIANTIELLAPHANLSPLCYPSLIRLVAYDEAKGTNLAYTLYKYLENPKNPAQVCEELFIHKNTLYFRLNKIASIMGTSFENFNEIAQINMTFEILKYQRRFDPLTKSNRLRTSPNRLDKDIFRGDNF